MIYKIGIDVGGTNTDAVILDQHNRIIEATKAPTTQDVETGIFNALDQVLRKAAIDFSNIKYVMLGTTHATNAIIEKKRLAKIAVVRICLPAGQSIEPMFTWDEELKQSVGNHYYFIHGGCEFDGRPLNQSRLIVDECESVLDQMEASCIESVAICSIFSPVLDKYEKEFGQLVRNRFGEDFPVTLSSEIGNLGLLERENSAALNAALVKVADMVAQGLEKALHRYGIQADIYFAQNDGTLMSLEYAKKYPILTIGSGPTNSIRGAAFLSDFPDCIVCDIGGTTTDVGILIKGFPRESSVAVNIGGVRTNFRMPDIISIGIGGGSIVREKDGEVSVGPDSVGYNIVKESIAFGGGTLTATDCILASGLAIIDHPACDVSRLESISPNTWKKAMAVINRDIAAVIDKIKTSSQDVPVVLVGGGAILIQGQLEGVSQVIQPNHAGCANAIGAAIAQVSGEVDKMFSTAGRTRQEVIEEVEELVKHKTITAGADPATVTLIDMEEVPVAYVPSNVVRIKAKAAGTLLVPVNS
ncbi:hydantoinase/oxoprolinase family protein [Aneurinibacillus sp. Ricciae_BoGa-3]|uniref:hydantoinase/oxoprolinase family protein n=1 Tax=Aneurinibacillus sp. Ricciae_BoGa-3 TaxID=3022697 RepID=UPI002341714C|nr:hydantoinase/oxoprolinase family protein [Aneurinibacillus sp. Ricciae_BoGa-3]WCK52611.1 hydantoinase/oxoprolinase family protein [Aneurinibacillus sp. Ricciae_BoGa-3]